MKDFRHPTTREIVDAYRRVKATGLKHIRIGNVGVFVRTEEDQEYFQSHVDKGAF